MKEKLRGSFTFLSTSSCKSRLTRCHATLPPFTQRSPERRERCVTSPKTVPHFGGALRDIPKNFCEGDHSSNAWHSCIYIISIILIYTHHLLAHNRPIEWPVPSWPDSPTGGALHLHRRGLGSNPRSGLNFSGHTRYCLSRATNCEDYSPL